MLLVVSGTKIKYLKIRVMPYLPILAKTWKSDIRTWRKSQKPHWFGLEK